MGTQEVSQAPLSRRDKRLTASRLADGANTAKKTQGKSRTSSQPDHFEKFLQAADYKCSLGQVVHHYKECLRTTPHPAEGLCSACLVRLPYC